MDYCILNDETIIENMIVCEDDTTAELFGAVPAYEGQGLRPHTPRLPCASGTDSGGYYPGYAGRPRGTPVYAGTHRPMM